MVGVCACAFEEKPIGALSESSSSVGDGDSDSDGGSGTTSAETTCGEDTPAGAARWEAKRPMNPTYNFNAAMAVATRGCSVYVGGRLEEGSVIDGAMFIDQYDAEGTRVSSTIVADDPDRGEEPFDLAVRGDGSVVVVGQRAGADDGPSTIPMLWAFAADGELTHAIEREDWAYAIAIASDGAVWVNDRDYGSEGALRRLDAAFATDAEIAGNFHHFVLGANDRVLAVADLREDGNALRVYEDLALTVDVVDDLPVSLGRVAEADDGDAIVVRYVDGASTLERIDTDAAASLWKVDVEMIPNDIAFARNGTTILGGSIGNETAAIAAYDGDGAVVWSTEAAGGTATSYPGAAIAADDDGNAYFATGYTIPETFNHQAWLIGVGG